MRLQDIIKNDLSFIRKEVIFIDRFSHDITVMTFSQYLDVLEKKVLIAKP